MHRRGGGGRGYYIGIENRGPLAILPTNNCPSLPGVLKKI
jgi:hypothetical protein